MIEYAPEDCGYPGDCVRNLRGRTHQVTGCSRPVCVRHHDDAISLDVPGQRDAGLSPNLG